MAYLISEELEVEGDPTEPGKITVNRSGNSITLQGSTTMSSSYSMILPPALGALDESLIMASPTVTGWGTIPATGQSIWFISEEQPSGTSSGTFTASVWNTRILNTITQTPAAGTDVQLAVAPALANQILVQPGTYFMFCIIPASTSDAVKGAIWNETAGSYLALSNGIFTISSGAFSTTVGQCFVIATATFASATVLSARMYPINPTGVNSGGPSTGSGANEIYTKLYIQKY